DRAPGVADGDVRAGAGDGVVGGGPAGAALGARPAQTRRRLRAWRLRSAAERARRKRAGRAGGAAPRADRHGRTHQCARHTPKTRARRNTTPAAQSASACKEPPTDRGGGVTHAIAPSGPRTRAKSWGRSARG